MNLKLRVIPLAILGLLFISSQSAFGQDVLSASDLLGLKSCGGIQLSPDGSEIIYSLSTPRTPNDEPGGAESIYYRMPVTGGTGILLFDADVKGSSPMWSPDGKYIGFLCGKNDESRQVWAMPSDGGEMFRLTNAESGVSYFRWQPDSKGIAYLSRTPSSDREKELKKRGYGFIYYEENLKNNNLFITLFDKQWNQAVQRQLTEGVNTWDFEFNGQGTKIAATISPRNLIDEKYMFRKIYLIDTETGERKKISENEGKLGNYAFSPDGTHLIYAAALTINDHQVSQVYVINLETAEVSNLTPGQFRGHVSWVNWKDDANVLYYSGEGVYPIE